MTEEHLPEMLPPEPVTADDPAVTTFPEPDRLLLQMPVDIRNMSLMVLAGLAMLFVLHWAKAIFIPVMLGVLFSYALSPVVNWLELKRVPRWLGSSCGERLNGANRSQSSCWGGRPGPSSSTQTIA